MRNTRRKSLVPKLGAGLFLFLFAGLGWAEDAPNAQEWSFSRYLAETTFIRSDFYLRFSHLPSKTIGTPLRLLASLQLDLTYSPVETVTLHLGGLGRLPYELTFMGSDARPTLSPFADFSETYLKLAGEDFTIFFGTLVVPWRSMRGAGLVDRVNPIDYRPGISFSERPATISQPGVLLRTSIGEASFETFAFLLCRRPNIFDASIQDGVQPARYQGATLRDSSDCATADCSLKAPAPNAMTTPSLGVRLKRPLGPVDTGFSIYYGFNDNALAPVDHVLSIGIDASVAVGVTLLKAELLAEPRIGSELAHRALVTSGNGIADVSHYAAGLALEGSYGDWFNASVELFDRVWVAVPQGQRLLAVERFDSNFQSKRNVHRLAAILVMDGAVWQNQLKWYLKGEAGITQPDVLLGVDLRYAWEKPSLYVGAFGNVFVGVQGSPGWFRQNATSFGAFVGHLMP